MKKQLLIGTALAVFAAPALATKARLLALGEDFTGSLYIKDSRNVFLNAATVNDYKNLAVFEWGNQGAVYNPGAGQVIKQDADNRAQAEGGVFFGHGDMVYGIYLGAETFQSHDARRYLNFQNNAVHQDNQLDLFVGGGSNIKWGANVTYSKTEDDSIDSKGDSASIRFGAIASKWEAFANISVMNKFEGDLNSSGTDEEFDGKLGFEIGGNYDVGTGKVFAFWRHAGWDQKSDNAVSAAAGTANGGAYVGEAEAKVDKYIVGWGNAEKISDKATIYWKASYVANRRMLDTKNDGEANLNDYAVPVTIGLEHDSLDWLVLRGSITHNLVGQTDNDYDTGLSGQLSSLITNAFVDGKRTLSSTNVNAGTTVKFGDFSVDGLVGVGTSTSTNESGVLTTDNIMSRVAMTYKW